MMGTGFRSQESEFKGKEQELSDLGPASDSAVVLWFANCSRLL
jgi:hypothetical protein